MPSDAMRNGVMDCSQVDPWWECQRGETYYAEMQGKLWYLSMDPSDQTSLRTRTETFSRRVRFTCG